MTGAIRSFSRSIFRSQKTIDSIEKPMIEFPTLSAGNLERFHSRCYLNHGKENNLFISGVANTADARCTVDADTDNGYEKLKQITYLTTQITTPLHFKNHTQICIRYKKGVGSTIGACSQQMQRGRNVF